MIFYIFTRAQLVKSETWFQNQEVWRQNNVLATLINACNKCYKREERIPRCHSRICDLFLTAPPLFLLNSTKCRMPFIDDLFLAFFISRLLKTDVTLLISLKWLNYLHYLRSAAWAHTLKQVPYGEQHDWSECHPACLHFRDVFEREK